MDRLLQYSLEHTRPVRIIWEEDGKLLETTAQVERLTETEAEVMATRPKRRLTILLKNILAVDYRKSDRDLV